jgi:lysophospholipase L1-like esterase
MNTTDPLGPVIRRRAPLERTRAALARGQLTVGFLGGSITDPSTFSRWPEPLLGWLSATFPEVRLTAENAALGATGSDLAAIRAQSAIVARGCDLVFVEYAVNDLGTPAALRARTREGLLRQLLLPAACDVVLVYTYGPDMQADMLAGTVPASIADFELLAEHYGLSSVWVGLHSLREVQRGLMTWEDWLPDGLHPEARGSLSYAQAVRAFLSEAVAGPGRGPAAPRPALPAALVPGAWDRVRLLPFAAVRWSGPWFVQRWQTCRGLEQVLLSTGPGARLRLEFTGRGLVLGFDFGKTSGEFRHRLDGGAWETTKRDCPAWAGAAGWLRPVVISDGLTPGPHQFELETLPGSLAEVRGTRTAIGFFGVIE